MLSIQAFMGDKDAQYTLGYHYLLGTGGYQRNETESVTYFRQAAGNGHEEALFMLIFIYEAKKGEIKPEDKEAVKWYKLAADKKLSIAEWRVAQMYEHGTHGITKNEKEAAARYKKTSTLAENEKYYGSPEEESNLFFSEMVSREEKLILPYGEDYLIRHRKTYTVKKGIWESEGRKKSLSSLIALYEKGSGGLSKDDPDAPKFYKIAAQWGIEVAISKVIDFYEQGKLEDSSSLHNKNTLTLYCKAGELGSEKALSGLIEFYENQGGLANNYFYKAGDIYKMAANRGNRKALEKLVEFYTKSVHCIIKAEDKIINLLKLAAEQEISGSEYLLAYAYDHSSIRSKNETEIITWYKKAAIKGNINAIYRLLTLFKGNLPLDDEQAAFCYKLALEAKKDPKLKWGSEIDKFEQEIIYDKLIELYEQGRGGLSKDDPEAGKFYQESHPKQYKKEVYYTLAQMYEYGRGGLVQDDKSAAMYYGYAEREYHPQAILKFIEFREQGRAGLFHSNYGNDYIHAANLGNIIAQYRLAQIYSKDKKNDAQTLSLYKSSAEGGHKDAQFALGEWYENGRGDLTVDPNAALLWYEKSAEQGHADAQYHAGRLHTLGINGMAIDLVKAKHWYTKAADQNHAYAKQALARLANVTSAPLPKTNAAQPSIAIPETSHHIHSSDITLHEVIGVGGFGKVYRATWKNSTVAAKELYNSQSTEVVKNFSAETAIMFRLRHPNIVQIFGVSVDKIPFLMVMEYIEGGSLYKLLRSRQPLSWNDMRLPLTKGIADGVAYLHAKEIIYRDLKSLNVLVRSKTAVLTDFGLAQAKKLATQSKSKHADGLIGTLPWMAPELFKMGGKHNEKTDVFAFAVTLWEISTARVPFDDQDNQASLHIWVTNGQRENIPNDCPPIIKQIIERCWDGNPDVRPSMTEVVDWLATGNAPTLHAAQSGYVPALYIS